MTIPTILALTTVIDCLPQLETAKSRKGLQHKQSFVVCASTAKEGSKRSCGWAAGAHAWSPQAWRRSRPFADIGLQCQICGAAFRSQSTRCILQYLIWQAKVWWAMKCSFAPSKVQFYPPSLNWGGVLAIAVPFSFFRRRKFKTGSIERLHAAAHRV